MWFDSFLDGYHSVARPHRSTWIAVLVIVFAALACSGVERAVDAGAQPDCQRDRGSPEFFVVSSADFNILNGAPVFDGRSWLFASPLSNDGIAAPLPVSPGYAISDIAWTGVFGSLTVALVRVPVSGGGPIEIIETFSRSQETSLATHDTADGEYGGWPHQVMSGYSYQLEVGGGSMPASWFIGATIQVMQ